MQIFNKSDLKKLYVPPSDSHKGQNGKLLLISGSKLFHSSSLWALKVASRILDMVYYCSVDENNEIAKQAKQEFRDGIVVSRNNVEDYIQEADCILIGPGLPRKEGQEVGDDDTKVLTESLLKKYPNKRWVIDGGSLQVIDPEILKLLKNPILTPHHGEFEMLFKNELRITNPHFAEASRGKQESRRKHDSSFMIHDSIKKIAKKYGCIIILKGSTDFVCSPQEFVEISGGNAGMTKGGTGDVLAALIASLYCKNEAFLSAEAGSYINKKAGESLSKRVGYYFNSSDLVDEIPRVMKDLILP
jgi:ADP-dependent NAD(P)H-hydrate dehydratase / NAD(P)H-hydrate epimerase